jgi:hypothetical protein
MQPRGYFAACHRVQVVSRAELAHCRQWRSAFSGSRKHHRYYELVEDTIRQGFDYRYFVIRDALGEVRATQPFFILDQDLLAGSSQRTGALVAAVRRLWPRFLKLRTLMVAVRPAKGISTATNSRAPRMPGSLPPPSSRMRALSARR